jgi:hypothetical protein
MTERSFQTSFEDVSPIREEYHRTQGVGSFQVWWSGAYTYQDHLHLTRISTIDGPRRYVYNGLADSIPRIIA